MSEFSEYDIAIIGMSGRFPKALDVYEFWDNIKKGNECISFFSDSELLEAGVSSYDLDNPNYVKASGSINDYDKFDAAFFGINPKEAELMDPQHRIFLECVWEALENAGYVPEKFEGSIGVYAGASLNTYLLNNICKSGEVYNSASFYPVLLGNGSDFLCTRASYKLNLNGPSITVQTACSTSLVAVHMACQSLLNGECDMALAGGSAVRAPGKSGYMYQDGGIMSDDGHCRPFDIDAKGTVMSSGAGVVVLKRISDAVKSRDHIYAVIKGSAINNDGVHKVGFTAPSVEGQSKVISEALSIAGVEPESVSYVEAHGTGTALGDPIEITALKKVFGKKVNSSGNKTYIGSLKANYGHMDTAAGVAGLMKAAFILKEQVIPPSINFNKPNPKLELENSPFEITKEERALKSSGYPCRAGVSSFGLGGTNAHVVLEESPLKKNYHNKEDKRYLIPVSARTQESLESYIKKLETHVERNPGVSIRDMAFTLSNGRKEFPFRRCFAARNREDFLKAIRSNNGAPHEAIPDKERVLTFCFNDSDQMLIKAGGELYRENMNFKANADKCFEIIRSLAGEELYKRICSFKELNGGENTARNKTLEEASSFIIQYSLAELLKSWGIRPDIVFGSGSGDFAAACVSGAISLESALAVIVKRAEITGRINVNPDSDVILKSLKNLTDSRVETAAVLLGEINNIKTLKPSMVYISGKYGSKDVADELLTMDYWTSGLAEENPQYTQLFDRLEADKSNIVFELGNSMGKLGINSGKNVYFISADYKEQDVSFPESLFKALGQLWASGSPINWDSLYQDETCWRIPLPTYSFEKKRYWIDAQNTGASAAPELKDNTLLPQAANNGYLGSNEIEKKLIELWENHLDVEGINITDDYFDIGGDSFLALQMNADITDIFGIKLPLKDLIENTTIEKLTKVIFKELNKNKNSGIFSEDIIVRLQPKGNKIPFFCIHPAGGTVMGYHALSKYLGHNQPLYGIQYPFIRESSKVEHTMEELAATYIKAVKSVQPAGPYILGGHSYGGNMAFEMATQMQSMGEEVKNVILFDSHPPLSYYGNEVLTETQFKKSFPWVARMYFGKNLDLSESIGEEKFEESNDLISIIDTLKYNSIIPKEMDAQEIADFYRTWKNNHNSLRLHMPKSIYNGKITLIRAAEKQPENLLKLLNIKLEENMDIKEWGNLSAKPLQIFTVAGNHYTMLNDPGVKEAADIIKGLLE